MKDVNCTEIVIKIPDRIQYGIENGITVNGSEASQIVLDAVKNGTPLPKGHGRLVDEYDVMKSYEMGEYDLNDCPTIIEADEEGLE